MGIEISYFYTDSFQNQLELVAVSSLFARGIIWALSDTTYEWTFNTLYMHFFFQNNAERIQILKVADGK